MLLGGICSIPIFLLGKINYGLGRENFLTGNLATAAFKETLGAAKVIMSFGEKTQGLGLYLSTYDANRKVTVTAQTLSFAIALIYESLGIISLIGALFAAQVVSVPISETAVVIWSLRNILGIFGQIVSQGNLFLGFLPSYEQVQQLQQTAQHWEVLSGNEIFGSLNAPIQLEHISFAYSGKNPVLVDLNLQIPQGKRIAIVGKSGSGKSNG